MKGDMKVLPLYLQVPASLYKRNLSIAGSGVLIFYNAFSSQKEFDLFLFASGICIVAGKYVKLHTVQGDEHYGP